jgi:hypothetical protein
MAERRARPSIGQSWRNFREYDAPLRSKLRMFAANNWRKVRTRRDCCGNDGEPGC